MAEDSAPGDHEHAESNKNEFEERNSVSETVTTLLHLWSAVLKEQSKYFEAEMLRWSEQPPSSSCSWRYMCLPAFNYGLLIIYA